MAGRKSKYNTEQERKEAQIRWSREYYERNKEKIRKKNLRRYYEKKRTD